MKEKNERKKGRVGELDRRGEERVEKGKGRKAKREDIEKDRGEKGLRGG